MENLDKQILKELKYGSKAAFESLFKTHYSPLLRYAEEILRDPDQAEDVVENLFVIIWEDRKKIDFHTSFKSYLYRSTFNACLNLIRKKKSENRYRDFFIHHADFSKTHDYGSGSYPLSGIIEKEMDEMLKNAIDNLPPQCKRIFIMSRVDELSHQEIADKLGLSVNTIKSQIMNAIKKITFVMKEILTVFVFVIL